MITAFRRLGAVEGMGQPQLRAQIAQLDEQLINVGRLVGDLRGQGVLDEAQVIAADLRIQQIRDRSLEIGTAVEFVSQQEVPAVQAQLDELMVELENLRRSVMGSGGSGTRKLLSSAILWTALGVTVAGGFGYWLLRKSQMRR